MNCSKVEFPGVKLLEEKRQYLKTLYPLDTRNPWKQEYSDGHVLLHSQLDPRTGLKIIRSQIKISAPKEKVKEFANDVNAILEWDKTIDGVKTISSTQDYLIVYALAKKVTMSKQRESLMISKCYTEDDGRILGVACSIEHPSVPHCDKKVRITAYLVGWVLKTDPTNPNVTNFIKVLHINPEGHVPSSIFNKFTHAQGLNVKAFGDYAERKWQHESTRTQSHCQGQGQVQQVQGQCQGKVPVPVQGQYQSQNQCQSQYQGQYPGQYQSHCQGQGQVQQVQGQYQGKAPVPVQGQYQSQNQCQSQYQGQYQSHCQGQVQGPQGQGRVVYYGM